MQRNLKHICMAIIIKECIGSLVDSMQGSRVLLNRLFKLIFQGQIVCGSSGLSLAVRFEFSAVEIGLFIQSS